MFKWPSVDRDNDVVGKLLSFSPLRNLRPWIEPGLRACLLGLNPLEQEKEDDEYLTPVLLLSMTPSTLSLFFSLLASQQVAVVEALLGLLDKRFIITDWIALTAK